MPSSERIDTKPHNAYLERLTTLSLLPHVSGFAPGGVWGDRGYTRRWISSAESEFVDWSGIDMNLVADEGTSVIEIAVEFVGLYAGAGDLSTTSGSADTNPQDHIAVYGGVYLDTLSLSQEEAGQIHSDLDPSDRAKPLDYYYAHFKGGLTHELEKTYREDSRGEGVLPCREGMSLVGLDEGYGGPPSIFSVPLEDWDHRRPIKLRLEFEAYDPGEHDPNPNNPLLADDRPRWGDDASPDDYPDDRTEDDDPNQDWLVPWLTGISVWGLHD